MTEPTAQPQTQAVATLTDHAPALYGGKDEVRSLAARIMSIHPSAKKLGDRGALLLAQLGIALGLNPLPGTGQIFAWIDDDGFLCVHIGLEGRTSLARRQSPYSVKTRPMRPDEFEEHALKLGDRGAIAELFRHDLTRATVALGIPLTPIVGIGIARANERVPKGRSLAWRASQRAIKDALRLAYSFELPSELAGAVRFTEEESAVPAGVIEGEFVGGDAETAGSGEASPAQADDPIVRPFSPVQTAAWLADKATSYGDREANAKQRGLFVSKLAECFGPDLDADAKRKIFAHWVWGVDSSKQLTGAQIIAGLDWLNMTRDSGGEYLIDSMAVHEAQAIVEQATRDASGGDEVTTEPAPNPDNKIIGEGQ